MMVNANGSNQHSTQSIRLLGLRFFIYSTNQLKAPLTRYFLDRPICILLGRISIQIIFIVILIRGMRWQTIEGMQYVCILICIFLHWLNEKRSRRCSDVSSLLKERKEEIFNLISGLQCNCFMHINVYYEIPRAQ